MTTNAPTRIDTYDAALDLLKRNRPYLVAVKPNGPAYRGTVVAVYEEAYSMPLSREGDPGHPVIYHGMEIVVVLDRDTIRFDPKGELPGDGEWLEVCEVIEGQSRKETGHA